MIRIASLGLVLVLTVPIGQAQGQVSLLDCSGGCTTRLFGLGDDPAGQQTDITFHKGSHSTNRGGRANDEACGAERRNAHYGQVRITDQDSCVVSNTNTCMVEMAKDGQSGHLNVNDLTIDFGPLGVVRLNAGIFADYGGNLGIRQLLGSCTDDGGEECGVDGDCSSGTGCRSTCFSTGGLCGSHGDCPNADCITEIDWDPVGRCSDNAGDGEEMCTGGTCSTTTTQKCSWDAHCPGGETCVQDLACPAGEECLDGITIPNSPESCLCCQSTSGVICSTVAGGVSEYPAINCPYVVAPVTRRDTSDWEFDGGREATFFETQRFTVAGQQEGLCAGDPILSRPCGAKGDFWAGAENGKCENGGGDCPDPFNPDNPSLASGCDDVDFGGRPGDFCDLSENGWSQTTGQLLPDTRPDPIQCRAPAPRRGFLNERCRFPIDIPEGDPQPGCRLLNYALEGRPDQNCNSIDDAEEGRCFSETPQGPFCNADADCDSAPGAGDGICVNTGDTCPFIGERAPFLDSNNDGRGDECQCGDANGDGAITNLDIGAVALCANGAAPATVCDATIVDSTGDNATTAEDIGGIVAAVNGVIEATDLVCLRNLDLTPAP